MTQNNLTRGDEYGNLRCGAAEKYKPLVDALRKIKARIHAERYECTPLTVDDAATDAEKELMCIIDYIEAEVDEALALAAPLLGGK